MTITIPTAPALTKLPAVELIQTGTWEISTGTWTVTTEDLRQALASQECPAVRRPVLKLGHTDARFDGEPAIGSVANIAVVDDGRTLVGDFVGIPTWLADILPSAYPDRSVEGFYDFTCQLGHCHPFVLTAVALLGVTPPGVGTLQSLSDVATLYGVTAGASPASDTPDGATPVLLTIKETAIMAKPVPRHVAATTSAEDVRRAFYDSPAGKSYDVWIEEIQIDPLQVIVVDDASNTRSRVPVTIDPAKNGTDAITFGAPVPVVMEYHDVAPAAAPTAASAARFQTRAQSRAGVAASASTTAPALAFTPDQHAQLCILLGIAPLSDFATITAALQVLLDAQAGQTTTAATSTGSPSSTVDALTLSAEEHTAFCQMLGIDPGSDAATIVAAVAEVLAEQPVAATASAVTIEAQTYASLVAAADRNLSDSQVRAREQRRSLVTAAIQSGKIPPATEQHWLTLLETTPTAGETLRTLPPGLVPLAAMGHTALGEARDADAELYDTVFPSAPVAATASPGDLLLEAISRAGL